MKNFVLGEIVTLKSHPFYSINTEILISADATMIPPVMVIIEILNDYKKIGDFDEKTGIQQSNGSQVKCLFYSHKTHRYESNWLLVDQIKKINNEELIGNEDLTKNAICLIKESDINTFINKKVILKSWKIELGKKRSNFSDDTYSNKKINKVTGHLSFLPPVMIVVGSKKIDEIKDSNFDKKTGLIKREFSKILLKCKWFNSLTNTFSEDFFTPEALDIVEDIDSNVINDIQDFIKNKIFLRFNNHKLNNFNNGNTIGKPLKIVFNHCYYELEYFDFLTNKNETIELLDLILSSFKKIEVYSIEYAPFYNDLGSLKKIKQFLKEEIEEVKIVDKIFRIQYETKKGILSTRTIFKCKYFNNQDDIEDSESKKNKFIIARCIKREGRERCFRFKGIKRIEVLNFDYSKKNY